MDQGTKLKLAQQRSSPSDPNNKSRVEWLVSSGTKLQANHQLSGKLCDFLARQSWSRHVQYFAVELKSRVQNINAILAQLQSGAALIERSGATGPFAAVLVNSGRMSTHELRVLRTKRVVFRGQLHPVITMRSGSTLA